MQWAIGDWFNTIPECWSDKRAACEEAGLTFETATVYGSIAKAFPHLMRIKALSFSHHQKVAALVDDQRTSLLRRAEWGEEGKDGKRKPWTVATLVQERDKILGKEKIPLPDFDAKVDKAVVTECYPADKKTG